MRFQRLFLSAGFTLVEMMIVLAVVAILVGIGMPSFNDSLRDKRLSALTSEFISSVYVARNESLTRRKLITLTPIAAGWQAGWTINDGATVLHRYVNPNVNQNLPANQAEMQVLDTGNAPLAIAEFDFNPNGRVSTTGGATASINILICDDRTGERGRTLTLSPFGALQNTVHDDASICNP